MIIATIDKTDKTQIRLTKDTVNGKTFGQIRIWTKVNDEYVPTRKGIAFGHNHISELQVGLEQMKISFDLPIVDDPPVS
jgi:hypothetical protein